MHRTVGRATVEPKDVEGSRPHRTLGEAMPNHEPTIIGERLKKARLARKLSRPQLADLSGLTKLGIAQVEQFLRRDPAVSTLTLLVIGLSHVKPITADYLLGLINTEVPRTPKPLAGRTGAEQKG